MSRHTCSSPHVSPGCLHHQLRCSRLPATRRTLNAIFVPTFHSTNGTSTTVCDITSHWSYRLHLRTVAVPVLSEGPTSVLGPIQPPTQWVRGVVSAETKWTGQEANNKSPHMPQEGMCAADLYLRKLLHGALRDSSSFTKYNCVK